MYGYPHIIIEDQDFRGVNNVFVVVGAAENREAFIAKYFPEHDGAPVIKHLSAKDITDVKLDFTNPKVREEVNAAFFSNHCYTIDTAKDSFERWAVADFLEQYGFSKTMRRLVLDNRPRYNMRDNLVFSLSPEEFDLEVLTGFVGFVNYKPEEIHVYHV